jgi:hypothetical protein
MSGINKVGTMWWLLGTLAMLTGVGNIIAASIENTTLIYFMLFVDKYKLEFKVINKDLIENDKRTVHKQNVMENLNKK